MVFICKKTASKILEAVPYFGGGVGLKAYTQAPREFLRCTYPCVLALELLVVKACSLELGSLFKGAWV